MIIIPLMTDYKKGKGVNIEEVGKEREGEIEEEKVTESSNMCIKHP